MNRTDGRSKWSQTSLQTSIFPSVRLRPRSICRQQLISHCPPLSLSPHSSSAVYAIGIFLQIPSRNEIWLYACFTTNTSNCFTFWEDTFPSVCHTCDQLQPKSAMTDSGERQGKSNEVNSMGNTRNRRLN